MHLTSFGSGTLLQRRVFDIRIPVHFGLSAGRCGRRLVLILLLLALETGPPPPPATTTTTTTTTSTTTTTRWCVSVFRFSGSFRVHLSWQAADEERVRFEFERMPKEHTHIHTYISYFPSRVERG